MNTSKPSLLRQAIHGILAAAACAPVMLPIQTEAAELPMVCIAGSCGTGGPASFVTSGNATAVSVGNTLTVTQSSDRAILNWASFNVSADGHVIFNQPSSTSIALNRIFQNSPSRIFGQVTANGEIYLVNPNGIVFGKTAQINAAGILASTLGIKDSVFNAGIAAPNLGQNALPSLESDGRVSVIGADMQPVHGTLDADGNIVVDPSADPLKVQLLVQEGAKLATTVTNGRILLASQNVDNAGLLNAADGQVILAAGDKVFLQAGDDNPALRGLLVEVGMGGNVWNRVAGQINTPRGNSTLVGYAVNQEGRISATTTASANGSIRLLARDSAVLDTDLKMHATRTGSLSFGSQSETSIVPELLDTTTAVDAQTQFPSYIEAMGHQVTIKSGSTLRANGGRIDLSAIKNPARGRLTASGIVEGEVADKDTAAGDFDAESQLRIESGATIDLSGSDAALPMSRNLVSVELRASELSDSPNQRASAIRGKPLIVDVRQGTPLGNIDLAVAAIKKTVAERTAKGGTAVFVSDGDIVAASGSQLNVSGGKLTYDSGVVQTSQLIGADGKIYDVGSADPNRTYVGVINPTYRRVDDKWGQVTVTPLQNTGHYESGYVEGASAGTVQFVAPTMVLNGSFIGQTTSGPFQRTADKNPTGGTLIVGLTHAIKSPLGTQDYYGASSVTFVNTAPTIIVANGASLATLQSLSLPIDYLRNGFTHTRIFSNGAITLGDNTPLQLVPGSSFELSADRINVNSSIQSLGGSIGFTSRDTYHAITNADARPGISIGSDVTFDVRGTWTNDSLFAPNVRLVDTLYYNGGTIDLALASTLAPTELKIGNDVSLLASGGAQLTQSGRTIAGAGGAIRLQTNTNGSTFSSLIDIGSRINMQAYGVLGAAGGSFTFNAPAIQVIQDSSWARPQNFDATTSAFFRVGTGLFSEYGFSTVQLTAGQPRDPSTALSADVVQIPSDIHLQAQVQSIALDTHAGQHASGGVIGGFSTVFLPEPYRRRSEDVGFTATLYSAPSHTAGNLNVQAGATLNTDVGGSFSFTSLGSLFIDGAIVAPGGKISAAIATPTTEEDDGYLVNQQLRIGARAVLNAAGAVVYAPNDLGLLKGVVSSGGAISLTAGRGSVVLAEGSHLDVSGTAASLDVLTGSGPQNYLRQTIASNAGSLTVSAREDIVLAGQVRAYGAAGSAAGSLTLNLTRIPSKTSVAPTFPVTPHVIHLSQADVVNKGPLDNGVVDVSVDFIKGSGFDSVALKVTDEVDSTGGKIILDSGLNLALDRQIVVDAAQLSIADGGLASLKANYVAIGNSNKAISLATSDVGNGQLHADGSFIDIIGSSVLSGIRLATFTSDGDIRLRGTQRPDGTVQGNLNIAGDMQFNAARMYASTATEFNLRAAGGITDRIQILQRGATNGTPLSVGSSIKIDAREIEQGGTLLAPFGSIALTGSNSVVLLDGSVTSVSGAGTVFPYGSVSNGTWSYNGGNSKSFESLATPKIAIKSDIVFAGTKATIDITGGGDLYAYEWVPGTGGTRDALSVVNAQATGLFAILPSLRGQFAPFDPQEYSGSTLQPGDSVYLSGLGDLQSGVYPLLPARYALLPGAILVNAVAGTLDATPGVVTTMLDGTRVVAGYRTFGNTQLGSNRYSGFAIHPGSYGRALAQYDDFYASSFLSARATRLELGRVRSPFDAGLLSLFATQRLDLQAAVKTTPATGGEGATIEISATRLAVTSRGSDSDTSTIDIGADQLTAWNPSRLLLGATHDANGALIVTADTVTIKDGAKLALDEITIAAKDHIVLESNSSLASGSGIDNSVSVQVKAKDDVVKFADASSAGSAVIAVSDLGELVLDRATITSPAGSIDIAVNAVVASRGSITIDAPGGGAISGNLQASGARTTIAANQLVFGEQQSVNAFTITQTLQNQLQASSRLRLVANESLQFSRDTALKLMAADSLVQLRSPIIAVSGSSADIKVNVDAATISIGGGAESILAPAVGSATLNLTAATLELDKGTTNIAGFARSTWEATSQVIGSDSGHVRLAGDLDVIAPAITLATGVDTFIESASGDIRLQKTANATAANTTVAGLGGSLTINARNIQDSLAINAPSGLVIMQASGNLDLASDSVIDVAGRMVSAGGRQLGSSGGTIRLSSGGALNAAAGSSLKLDTAGEGSAGRLQVRAAGAATLDGGISAHSLGNATGGSVEIEAASINDFRIFNERVQSAGFSESQHVHVRTGDLELAEGRNASARSIAWTTDDGAVRIAGTVSANSADLRGTIQLYGGRGVSLTSTAELNTDTPNGGKRGGDIEIGAPRGNIDIASASKLSAKGADAKGMLTLRTATIGNDVAVSSLATDLSNLSRVAIAPVFVNTVSAVPTATELSNAQNLATTFVNNAGSTIVDRFVSSNGAPIVVRPDIELRSSGDLTLGALDLSTWRFKSEPGSLTVRAAGMVNVKANATISDGFITTGSGANARVTLRTDESSNIRITGGADVASADPTATLSGAGVDLSLGANSIVRTGTGSLSLKSSQDIVFNPGATAYTGGLPGVVIPPVGSVTVLFPDLGGTLIVNAGRDIVGSSIAQSVSSWQHRGTRSSSTAPLPKLWGINATAFRWNLGALGGGDVIVSAGGDISNLSAAAADSARVDKVNDSDVLKTFGGGSMAISAGRDIASGDFFGARGALDLSADRSLSSIRSIPNLDPIGTLLWMADTSATVHARKDLLLETVINPTTLPIPNLTPSTKSSVFSTYTARSSIDLQSTAGKIVLQNNKATAAQFLEGTVSGSGSTADETFALYPSSLRARAYSGDIFIKELTTLYPSANGNVELFAYRDISSASINGGIRMSDADLASISTIATATISTAYLKETAKTAFASNHLNDPFPALITAGRDIHSITFGLPKSGHISADRDIVDLTLTGQNMRDSDVTLISAGRDFKYRPDIGNAEISIGGPGRLDILAGRDVDLGVTSGVTTTGRLLNVTLPSERGADITIMAGLGAQPDYAGFIDKIISRSNEYSEEVIAYVKQVTSKTLTFDKALMELRTLSVDVQRPLVDKVFFNELVNSGREANTIPDSGFKRGYLAVDSLFPGSRDRATSDYDGNLNLSFSRIYTLAGGDISLLIPGGLLNVGLANPPSSGMARTADKLGIVAQREGDVKIFADQDVLVNKSRVFTLLGGDIAVWSTHGNIDAGRGAKSSLSAPPPRVQIDASGRVSLNFSGAVTGSGIRGIITGEGVTPGDVDLIAPVGFVNAGDAGIGAAGKLNIAAQRVLGLDNIQVGGASTGVPAETSGLGASLAGVSNTASSSTNAANAGVTDNSQTKESAAPIAQSALSWLDVFVVGLGEDTCKQDDIECLKKQKTSAQ